MGGRLPPFLVAVAAAGAAVWVVGILLFEGQAATIGFAVVFAVALPAALHLAERGRGERRKSVGVAVWLLVMCPLAVLVFDERDELAMVVPAGMGAAILVNLWDSRSRPHEQGR